MLFVLANRGWASKPVKGHIYTYKPAPAYIFPSAANIKIHTTLYLPWLTSVYENHWLPPLFHLDFFLAFQQSHTWIM